MIYFVAIFPVLIQPVTPQLWEYLRCRTLEIVIVDTIYESILKTRYFKIFHKLWCYNFNINNFCFDWKIPGFYLFRVDSSMKSINIIVDGTIYYLVEVYDISVCHQYLMYYKVMSNASVMGVIKMSHTWNRNCWYYL